MRPDLDGIQRAELLILAVVGAVVNRTADTGVGRFVRHFTFLPAHPND